MKWRFITELAFLLSPLLGPRKVATGEAQRNPWLYEEYDCPGRGSGDCGLTG